MKRYLFFLITISSLILATNNVVDFYVNDAPVWLSIDLQQVDEDCGSCDTVFPFDLSSYVSDPDDDPIEITVSDSDHATFSIDGFNLVLD